ncbi:hypothetical protein [Streptomyces sp. SJL17-1]|uniref:hypothetical protein n=1 Tax=Streptomyces sp. SJL17-1 TaxID=2967223 RepID=UPI00296746EB|nr:hypothetical protein [Streptomyces sp. SJL17-1]
MGAGHRPSPRRTFRTVLTVSTLVAAVAGTVAGTAVDARAVPAGHVLAQASPDTPQPSEEVRAALAAAAAGAREQVRRVALSSLPAELRTSAWNALRHTSGDAAITAWLAPGGGYDAARQRLRDTRTRNRLFCERVVRTHPASFAPQTRAAAERALKGTDAERAAFVKTGYAQAQLSDRAVREAVAEEQRAVLERDREFVRTLVVRDPGEQVRVSAQWALRPGTTDEDVREFYAYGWMTGAALDLEGYQLRTSESEALRHRTLTLLLEAAAEAEDALRTASDVAAARAEAERAWQAVARHAGDAGTAWQAEREHAARQAETWRGVQELAQGAAEEMWKSIAGAAGANRQSWSQEEQAAGGVAAFWQEILRQAGDGETRVRG